MAAQSDSSMTKGSDELRRELGLLDATGIGFGAVVGAGVYVVIGLAAGIAGPAILIALLIAGSVAAANALSSAQLAARFPQSGGTYEYGYQVLNPWLGYIAGWMFLASKIAAAGTVAIGLGSYIELVSPGLETRWIAAGAILFFTALNYFGLRKSSTLNLAIVAVSTGALILLVAMGLPRVDTANYSPFLPFGWKSVLEASALLFFAYTGYARIATLGEEVRDPALTIPRAIIITIGGAIILYIAVGATAVGLSGAERISATGAPLAVVSNDAGPPWLRLVVLAGALAAMLGVILSQILGLSRMAFAMARRGDLPSALGRVHSRYEVPSTAVVAVGVVAAAVAATGALATVASAAAFTILIYYSITNMAALRQPSEDRRYHPVVPLFGLAGCAVLAISLPPRVMLIGSGVLLAGVLLRLIFGRGRNQMSS